MSIFRSGESEFQRPNPNRRIRTETYGLPTDRLRRTIKPEKGKPYLETNPPLNESEEDLEPPHDNDPDLD